MASARVPREGPGGGRRAEGGGRLCSKQFKGFLKILFLSGGSGGGRRFVWGIGFPLSGGDGAVMMEAMGVLWRMQRLDNSSELPVVVFAANFARRSGRQCSMLYFSRYSRVSKLLNGLVFS